jgi:cholesterol 24(S)-hydroxylase
MDLEAMIDDFVTFFIAGQETTANTLAFCFLEIGKKKEIFVRAREEVDRILGERTEITYQDTVDLKYCSCIFKEALRLYPAVPILDRHATDEIIINGYKIPSDTIYAVDFLNKITNFILKSIILLKNI